VEVARGNVTTGGAQAGSTGEEYRKVTVRNTKRAQAREYGIGVDLKCGEREIEREPKEQSNG
jgi:hypothetical protein